MPNVREKISMPKKQKVRRKSINGTLGNKIVSSPYNQKNKRYLQNYHDDVVKQTTRPYGREACQCISKA